MEQELGVTSVRSVTPQRVACFAYLILESMIELFVTPYVGNGLREQRML